MPAEANEAAKAGLGPTLAVISKRLRDRETLGVTDQTSPMPVFVTLLSWVVLPEADLSK